VESLETLNLY
jgi:hypothetical protein